MRMKFGQLKKDKLSQNLILNRLPYGFIKHQDQIRANIRQVNTRETLQNLKPSAN